MLRLRPSSVGKIFSSSSSLFSTFPSSSSSSSIAASPLLSCSFSSTSRASTALLSASSASSLPAFSSFSRFSSSSSLSRSLPLLLDDDERRKKTPSATTLSPFAISVRFQSRRATSTPQPSQGRRRVRVLEQEPEQPQQQQQQYQQQDLTSSWQQRSQPAGRQEAEGAPVQTELQALTPRAIEHLRKVYMTMGATIGVATAGTLISLVTPLGLMHPLIPGLGALLPLMGLYFTDPAKTSPTLRMGFLTSFALMSGMSLAPLIKFSLAINPLLIPTALGLSTALFGAMTAITFFSKRKAFLSLGTPLLGGTLVLLGAGIASFFVPATSMWYPVLHNVYLYGGLALFSAFVSYDTSRVIEEYEQGERDVLRHAVDFFINFKGIFVRLLQILTMSSRSD